MNGSGFAYTETNGSFSGQATAYLESPCFDLTDSIDRVQFFYQIVGNVDSFRLEVSYDDGISYNETVLDIPIATYSDWERENRTGLSIMGSVRFRFVVVFNSGNNSIVALDQLQLFGTSNGELTDCADIDCVENLTLNNTTVSEDFYRAKQQLFSNATIASSQDVTFTAGNQIILREGFVASNTTFTARIQDCNSVGFVLEEDYQRPSSLAPNEVEFIDRFGNGYRKDELAVLKSAQVCNSGFFNLIFLNSFTPSQEAVICNVFEDLSNIIIPRSSNPIVNVTIEKEALSAISPNIIAVGSPYWRPESCGVIYSRIEKAIMAADSTDDGAYHGFMKFNPDFLSLLYDGSQNSSDTLIDLYSITLHEAMHVLGFTSFIEDTQGNSIFEGVYSKYDQLLYSIEDDVPLIELDTNGDCCDQHVFNSSTSDNIRVGCSNMLYLWQDSLIAPVNGENSDVGNLLSHINDECIGQNYVMHPSIMRGELKNTLTLAEKEILRNIGYDIVGLSNSCELIAVDDIIIDDLVVIDDVIEEYNLVLPYDSIVVNDVIGTEYSLVFDSLCGNIRNATISSDGTNINFSTTESGTYILCYEISGCDGACDQGRIFINLNNPAQPVCTGCNITCISDFETIDTQRELFDSLVGGESFFSETFGVFGQNSPDLLDELTSTRGINNTRSIFVGFAVQDTIVSSIEGIFIRLNEDVAIGDTLNFDINAEFTNEEDTIYNPRIRVDFLSSDPIAGLSNSLSVYDNPGVIASYEYPASDAFYIQGANPVPTGGQIINTTDSIWTWAVVSARADSVLELGSFYTVGIVLDNIQMNKRRQVSLSSNASPSLSCDEGLYQLEYEICNLTDFGSAEINLDLSIPNGFTVVDGGIFGSDTTVVLEDDYIAADTCITINLLLEQSPSANINDVFNIELNLSGDCYNSLSNQKSVRIINNPLSLTKSFTETQGTYDVTIEVCNTLDAVIDSLLIEDAVPDGITLIDTGGFQLMDNRLFQYDSIPANSCKQFSYSMTLPGNYCRGTYFAFAEIEGSGCEQATASIDLNMPLVKPTINSLPSSNVRCTAGSFFIDYELFNDHCTNTDSITLELLVPTDVTIESSGLFANGNLIRIGNLQPSEKRFFRASFEIDQSVLPPTDLEIILLANADDPLYQEQSDTTIISLINNPLSSLSKTYTEVNDTFNFSITVCNNFSDSISNVEILDNIPLALDIVDAGAFTVNSTPTGDILRLDTILPPSNGIIDTCLTFNYRAIATDTLCPSIQRAIARIPNSDCAEISDTVIIVDDNFPDTDSSFTYVISCNTGTADFTASNMASGISHLWYFGDGDSSLLTNPSHTYATQGTFIVTHRVTNACDTSFAEQIVTYEPCANNFNCACADSTFIGTPPSGTTNISDTGLPLNYNNTSKCLQIAGTLVIDTSFTLTGGQIVLEPDAQILVQPNRTLTLNMATLQSCDNYMWQGINVRPDANLVLNNCLIADALRAVRTEGAASFQIDNSLFAQNYIGLDILGTPVNLGFSGNTMRCTNVLNNGDWGLYGIRCTNTALLQIGDESSTQVINRFEDIDYGIVSSFSNVEVYDAVFEDLRYAEGEQRVGLNTSIGVYGDISSDVIVAQSTFDKVYEGISINSSSCELYDNQMDTVNFGINMRNILSFYDLNVYNNTIQAAERGIELANASAAFPIIEDNDIEMKFFDYAHEPVPAFKAFAYGININLFQFITEYAPVHNNEITIYSQTQGFTPLMQGVRATSSSGVELFQNDVSMFGNPVTNTGLAYGYYFADLQKVFLKEAIVKDTMMQAEGIIAEASTDVSYCCNDLDVHGDGIIFTGMSEGTRMNLNKIGAVADTSFSGINCQDGTIIGRQIYNLPSTDLQRHRGNEFLATTYSFYGALHEGTDQEIAESIITVPDTVSIFYPPISGIARVSPVEFFEQRNIQVISDCDNEECLPIQGAFLSRTVANQLASRSTFTESPYSDMLNWEARKYLLKAIVENPSLLEGSSPIDTFRNNQLGTNLEAFTKLEDQWRRFFELDQSSLEQLQLLYENRSDLINEIKATRQIYRSTFNATERQNILNSLRASIQSLEQLKEDIKTQEDNILEQLKGEITSLDASNTSINALNILEENERNINAIYLTYLLQQELSAEQIELLLVIANQCPKLGGRYVHRARSLYNALVNPRLFDDEVLCGNNQPIEERRAIVEELQRSIMSLFPNPAYDQMRVKLKTSTLLDEPNIKLYDFTGNLILIQKIKDGAIIDLSTAEVKSGIYFCSLFDGQIRKETQRIVVIK